MMQKQNASHILTQEKKSDCVSISFPTELFEMMFSLTFPCAFAALLHFSRVFVLSLR